MTGNTPPARWRDTIRSIEESAAEFRAQVHEEFITVLGDHDSQPGTPVCFVDTETTSLRPDRRPWEVTVIRRDDAGETTAHWFTDITDLDLGNADLASLRIGGFHGRHPQMTSQDGHASVTSEKEMLTGAEEMTRGAHIIGAVPGFDAEMLAARMRAHGICPAWHHHLIDSGTLIIGWLRGLGQPVPPLPWRSDELAALIGVTPPGPGERHTSTGDARFARAIYDKVMGR